MEYIAICLGQNYRQPQVFFGSHKQCVRLTKFLNFLTVIGYCVEVDNQTPLSKSKRRKIKQRYQHLSEHIICVPIEVGQVGT